MSIDEKVARGATLTAESLSIVDATQKVRNFGDNTAYLIRTTLISGTRY